MKQHAEIIYNKIEQNEEYKKTIYKVIEECFKNEGLDRLKLYISITLTNLEVIQELNKNIEKCRQSLQMFCLFQCLNQMKLLKWINSENYQD